MIEDIARKLNEIISIISSNNAGEMSADDALKIARFYFECQDTNAVIDYAEEKADVDVVTLEKETAKLKTAVDKFLKDCTEIVNEIDFKSIADKASLDDNGVAALRAFRPEYLIVLVMRLQEIAESILFDIRRIMEEW